MPIVKTIKGDIIELFKSGQAPLIAHGMNCVNSMEAGVAKQIAENFPEVAEVDKKFSLPALYRLGDYSAVRYEQGVILNFYTQLHPGPNFEYSALRTCLRKLSAEATASGNYLELTIPKIGSGIGGGDWDIIKKILNFQENLLITVVEYDKGQVSMGEGEADSAS